MRLNLTAAVVTAGICLMIAGVVWADGTEERQTAVKLYRGTTIIAASDPSHSTYRANFTPEACRALKEQRWKAEAATKTSGSKVTYKCQIEERSIITFHPSSVVLSPVDCVVSAWGAWSDPAWLACADGMQSRSVVRTRTIVTQPVNGGAACPSLVETQPQTRVCPGTAILSWTPPTLNTDGTASVNIAGYRISHGLTADALTQTIQLASPGTTRYVIQQLAPGTRYFGVRAYTSAGTESALSNVVSKVIQ
jgi:hypothetical protein